MKFPNLRRLVMPLVAAAMMIAGFSSCDSDDPVYEQNALRLVTFRGFLPSGGMSFTFRTGETTPLITLTSTVSADTSVVKPGQRVIIGYTIPDNRPDTVSGSINLMSIIRVYNGVIEPASNEILASWVSAPVYNCQVWRTGNYINAAAYMPYGYQDLHLGLYYDEQSISDGSVDLYMTLNKPNTMLSSQMEGYASFQIRDFLHAHDDITTFRVFMPGPNSGEPVVFRNLAILPGE